ncbi:MAG TPA: hypothetical protein VHU84_17610 [Lacipirellulaceae bacterium]|nr:hypothetical protein [Lacipirellulaceae bacterium]
MRDLIWKTSLVIDHKIISSGEFFNSAVDDFIYLHTRKLEALWESGVPFLSPGGMATMLKCCLKRATTAGVPGSNNDATAKAEAALCEFLRLKLAGIGWQSNWSTYDID